MGYGENTKGYRIYVSSQREGMISHDVTFDEDMALNKVNNLPTLGALKKLTPGNQKKKMM